MLTTELVITIPGHPAPKGSLRCIGGRGGKGHVLIEDNKNTSQWRSTVAGWITRRWPAHQNADPGQPLGAEVTFTLPRPRGHYGTGRNADLIKDSAPEWPVSHATGDVDKLLRLILDALQDTPLVPDDCAILEVTARKTFVYGPSHVPDSLNYPGVVVRLYPL